MDYKNAGVDIEAGYEANRVQLLQEADKVLLITMQDAISTCKMEYIMQNLDFRDHEKYLVIMNRYRGDEMNCYMQSELQAQFPVKEMRQKHRLVQRNNWQHWKE